MESVSLHVREFRDQGGTANVYMKGDKVYKCLRRGGNLPEQLAHDLFSRELAAVQIVAKIPELAKYVPKFHGVFFLSEMIDHSGANVAPAFFTECVLVFDFVDGTPAKFEDARNSYLGELAERFRKYKIDIRDTTVFHAGNPDALRLVDYCTLAA